MFQQVRADPRSSQPSATGHQIDTALRQSMSAALGHDFARVRVHWGTDAARLANTAGATAFTIGHEIFLGATVPPLHTPDGRRLLAHELAHVVQQRMGALAASAAGAAAEQEADAAASAVVTGRPFMPRIRTGISLARKPLSSSNAPVSSVDRFNDFADLLNNFQELAAAALKGHGAGLLAYRLGSHLSVSHRNLLEDVRKLLIDGKASSSTEARQSAVADWQRVGAQLRESLDPARRAGINAGVIAAVADDLAIVGEMYLHARSRGPSQLESSEDYAEILNAVEDLLREFGEGAEGAPGQLRERVEGRPDAIVSTTMLYENTRQRTKLQAIKLGPHLIERHRLVVEKLRRAMLLARSEAPGSAHQALRIWSSIKSELVHVMSRSAMFLYTDPKARSQGLDNFGALLARHYELVHAETLATALKAPPTPAEELADRAVTQVAGERALAILHESRMPNQFRYMLTIIQNGLKRVPDRPGEWLMTSGHLQVRIDDDQATQLKEVAAGQLRNYMRFLVAEMLTAAESYESTKRGTSSFKLLMLGGWGGASDPGSQDHFLASVIRVRDQIFLPMVAQGEFLKSFDVLMEQKAVVEQVSKDVTDYDTDLDVGYSRLARYTKVLEVALTAFVPVAGEEALLLEGGATIYQVAGTAVATGVGVPVVVEGVREIASKEGLAAAKLFSVAGHGLTISLGAIAPAGTRALGHLLGGGQTAVAGMLAGDVASAGVTDLIADTTATGLVGGFQSFSGGGSFGQGFVASSITGLGRGSFKGAGLTGPIGSTLGASGSGAFGEWVSGGDPVAGAVKGAVSVVAGRLTAGPSRAPAGIQARGYPLGFNSRGQFRQFGQAARGALRRAGFDNPRVGIQGSAVNGTSASTGSPFDVGRVSDLDVAVVSPELFAEAQSQGTSVKASGAVPHGADRTAFALTPDQAAALGIADLALSETWGHFGGRAINVMVFATSSAAMAKEPNTIWTR